MRRHSRCCESYSIAPSNRQRIRFDPNGAFRHRFFMRCHFCMVVESGFAIIFRNARNQKCGIQGTG